MSPDKGHVVHVNSATLIMGVTGCLAGDTEVAYRRGQRSGSRATTLGEFYKKFNGIGASTRPFVDLTLPTFLHSLTDDGILFYNRVIAVLESGVQALVRITFDDGTFLRATPDHPVLTPGCGFVEASRLREGQEVVGKGSMEALAPGRCPVSERPPRILVNCKYHPFGAYKEVQGYEYTRVYRSRLVLEAAMNNLPYEEFVHALKHNPDAAAAFRYLPQAYDVHHVDEDTLNDDLGNLLALPHEEHARVHHPTIPRQYVREVHVTNVQAEPAEMTYDIQMDAPSRNFIANDIVVHNSGKSALLHTLADYVWETWGLVTCLYSSDGGGFPASVQTRAQKGIIRLFRMRTRDLPDGSLSFETCQRSAQGWWPKRINPATGEVLPGEALVPPITERYDMSCPNGHLVKSVPFQSLLTVTMCPKCKILTDKSNMRVEKTAHRTKGFEQVGAVCYDGITSMLSWMLSDMGQRSGRLELKGEEGAIGGKVISGDMKFGGNTRSHVGFAQNQAEALVLNSLGIPYLVVPPVFTALTMEVDDEGGLSVRGPKLAGRAKTDEGPQWFGNCLETMVIKNEKDQRIYRLCTAEFTDDAGVRHLTKNRADPGILPPYLEDPPLVAGHERETAFTNFNLGVFYQMLDEGLKTSLSAMGEKYPNAPGLPEGIVEVGEVASEVPAAPAAVVTPPAPKPSAPAAQAAPTGKPPAVPSGRPAAPPPRPAAAPAKPAVPPSTTGTVPAVQPVRTVPPVQQPAAPPSGNGPARWAAPAAPRPPAQAPRVPPAKTASAIRSTPTAASPQKES